MTYTVLGTVDDQDRCDCCGKTRLKRTVALRTDDGDVVYYGTTCAARATGWKAARLERDRIAADNKLDQDRHIVEHWAQYRGEAGTDLFIERNPHILKFHRDRDAVTAYIEAVIGKSQAALDSLRRPALV